MVAPPASGRMCMKPVSTSQSCRGTGCPESGRMASVASSSRPNLLIPSQIGFPSAGVPMGMATRANWLFIARSAGCPCTGTAGAQKPPIAIGAA